MSAQRYVPIGVILTVFAVNAPVSVSADRHDPPSDDVVAPQRPPAQREHLGGAPYYLHFGPTGLCVIGDGFDWTEVPAGGMVLDEASRVLAIEGSYDFDTVVDIQPVDQGTESPYDDEVRVTVTVYTNPDQIVAEEFPMWDAGSADLDQETTQNTPQSLYLERIEYRGAPDEVPTALTNNTRVPMHATGWFAQVVSGENGFHGGGGPDCVEASLLDDFVDTGGGDDYARLKDGNNVAHGGDGNDTLQATLGQDLLASTCSRAGMTTTASTVATTTACVMSLTMPRTTTSTATWPSQVSSMASWSATSRSLPPVTKRSPQSAPESCDVEDGGRAGVRHEVVIDRERHAGLPRRLGDRTASWDVR